MSIDKFAMPIEYDLNFLGVGGHIPGGSNPCGDRLGWVIPLVEGRCDCLQTRELDAVRIYCDGYQNDLPAGFINNANASWQQACKEGPTADPFSDSAAKYRAMTGRNDTHNFCNPL